MWPHVPEQLDLLEKKQQELLKCVREGKLPVEAVIDRLRALIEGWVLEDHPRCYQNDYATRFESVPEYSELTGLFDGVSQLWDGSKYELKTDESVGESMAADGNPHFLVKDLEGRTSSDRVREWAAKNGYRPAVLYEGLYFAFRSHPSPVGEARCLDAHPNRWIVILGSYVIEDDIRHYPILHRRADECYRYSSLEEQADPSGHEWSEHYNPFLLVRNC